MRPVSAGYQSTNNHNNNRPNTAMPKSKRPVNHLETIQDVENQQENQSFNQKDHKITETEYFITENNQYVD